MNLHKLLTVAFLFSFSILTNAQEAPKTESLKTAKEVIDRLIRVVGHSVSPYQNRLEVSIQKMGSLTIKKIELIDLSNETLASITFMSSNNSITRTLITKEKAYMFEENGTVNEAPFTLTIEMLGKIDYSTISNETTLLPDKEVFDTEEVYVLNQKETTMQGKIHLYYSVKTGLHIGSMLQGDSSPTYFYIKDYRLVDNKYLLPHKLVTSNDASKSNMIIKYNVDTEYFKNVTFKDPEAAIAAIPDEF